MTKLPLQRNHAQTCHFEKDKLKISNKLVASLRQLDEFAIDSCHQAFFLRYQLASFNHQSKLTRLHIKLSLYNIGVTSKHFPDIRIIWSEFQRTQRALNWMKHQEQSARKWDQGVIHRLEWLLGMEDVLAFENAGSWHKVNTGLASNELNLDNLLENLNQAQCLEHIMMCYEQLCCIRHYQNDKRRLANLFLEAVLDRFRQKGRYWLSPTLIRGVIEQKSGLLDSELDQPIDVWESTFQRLVDKQQEIHRALETFHSDFDCVLKNKEMPEGWHELKNVLMVTPLITMETAHKYLSASSFMFEYGLIELRHIKTMNNLTIFECPSVLDLWERWESIIGSNIG